MCRQLSFPLKLNIIFIQFNTDFLGLVNVKYSGTCSHGNNRRFLTLFRFHSYHDTSIINRRDLRWLRSYRKLAARWKTDRPIVKLHTTYYTLHTTYYTLDGDGWSTPRPGRFTPRNEAGWVPGPVWPGAENLATTGIRSPDPPARGDSLYRLRYPGPEWLSLYRQT